MMSFLFLVAVFVFIGLMNALDTARHEREGHDVAKWRRDNERRMMRELIGQDW